MRVLALFFLIIIDRKVRTDYVDIKKGPEIYDELVSETTTEKLQKVENKQTAFPLNLVDRFPELATIQKQTKDDSTRNPEDEIVTVETLRLSQLDLVKPLTVLNYKPITSFYHPRPVTLPQIIPSGTPWTSPVETTLATDLAQKTSDPVPTNTDDETLVSTNTSQREPTKKPIFWDYKPITSFYHPSPVTLPQIIPSGTQWPSSVETTLTDLAQKTSDPVPTNTDDETLVSTNTSQRKPTKKPIVLSYKPITSFYHPRPVTVAQIIPSGTPWPAFAGEQTNSPELVHSVPDSAQTATTTAPVYSTTIAHHSTIAQNVISTIFSPNLEYKPITSFHHPHPVTVAQIIPPGTPWPASIEENNETKPNLLDQVSSTTTTIPTTPSRIILTYKPSRPWYFPQNGVTPAQIIPPGMPLPASIAEKNETNPNLVDRVGEVSTTTITIPTTPSRIVLTYKPSRPWHISQNGVAPIQIIPPGKPLPASIEEKNESKPNLIDRVGEVSSTTITVPTTPSRIILTYKPSRPWHISQNGVTLAQIIPPGKPWPASAQDYAKFSATKLPPLFIPGIETELSDLQPNALQYYGGRITAPFKVTTVAPPFTSGTQRITLSDIADILKEAHKISLANGNKPPSPSHLLPFDVDNNFPAQSSAVIRRPVGGSQMKPALTMVYDGSGSSYTRERIFPNPKFMPKL